MDDVAIETDFWRIEPDAKPGWFRLLLIHPLEREARTFPPVRLQPGEIAEIAGLLQSWLDEYAKRDLQATQEVQITPE